MHSITSPKDTRIFPERVERCDEVQTFLSVLGLDKASSPGLGLKCDTGEAYGIRSKEMQP